MDIQLTAALHGHQPFRDVFDVTLMPHTRRFSGTVEPRRLIPRPDEITVEDWNI